MSGDDLQLTKRDGFAQLVFEKVSGENLDYNGNYESEFSFRGVGSFQLYESELDKYKAIQSSIQDSQHKIEGSEHRIYTNVLTIMSILVAVFSIADMSFSTRNVGEFAVYVLVQCGSFAVLFGLISLLVKHDNGWVRWTPWLVAAACFAAALLIGLVCAAPLPNG